MKFALYIIVSISTFTLFGCQILEKLEFENLSEELFNHSSQITTSNNKCTAPCLIVSRHYTNMNTIEENVGKMEMRQVICPEDISYEFISQLKVRLQKSGFNTDHLDTYDDRLKFILNSYQVKNSLPIGHLDFETLDALGIVYQDI